MVEVHTIQSMMKLLMHQKGGCVSSLRSGHMHTKVLLAIPKQNTQQQVGNPMTKMDDLIFHIYDSNNQVIKYCISVEEMEQMIAERKIDWKHWEIQPCYDEYTSEDASF